MFIPSETFYLPNGWAKTSSKYGFDAYSYGPDQTGVPLSSGRYFTGKWCAYYQDHEIIINKLDSDRNYALPSFTGFKLNWFSGLQSSSSISRFTNFALSFNNSGLPIVAHQDNGDSLAGFENKPYISVYQLSGASVISTGWAGSSPVLFNELQIGGGYVSSSGNDLRYQTGRNLCFYKRGDLINYRIQSGFSWSSEFIILTGDSDVSSINGIRVFEENFQNPYNPYKFAIIGATSDKRTLKVLTSKSYINYAFDNFDRQETGALIGKANGRYLTGGYGNWLRDFTIDKAIGLCLPNEISLYDSFGSYETGQNTGSSWFNKVIYQNKALITSGVVTGYGLANDLYFYDSFDSYETGFYQGFTGLLGNEFALGVFKTGYLQYSGIVTGYSIWSGYSG